VRGRTYLGKGMPHKTSFRTTQLQISNDCGVKTAINKSNFPILERLALNPGCFREPHWHANSHELSHCLKGKMLVTLFASGNQHSQFTISEGEMFFAPSGSFHAIENLSDSEWRFLIFFDNPDVQDIGFTGAIPASSDRMIGAALELTAGQVARIPKQSGDLLIVSKVNSVAK